MKKFLFKYWILKVIAYWILNFFPNKVLFFFQVRVIKRESLQIKEISQDFEFFSQKINSYAKKNEIVELLEFGAGKNLALNIYMSFVVPKINQTVIDINNMFDDNLFYQAFINISKILKIETKFEKNEIKEILEFLKIKYISPMDILNFNKSNKFDFCISRDTLEHIPKFQINNILKKINLLLKPRAFMIHKIDYSDHFSNKFNKLSTLNFLKFNSFVWNLLNPSNHYQNRLRHSDYIKLITNNKFKIIESNKTTLDHIDFKINNRFSNYLKDDLLSTSGKIVACKN